MRLGRRKCCWWRSSWSASLAGWPQAQGPVDFLRRVDENGNGMLDPNELEGRTGSFVRRMAENNPRIDLSRPIPLDRLASEFERMREERSCGGGGGRAAMGGGEDRRSAAAGHRSAAADLLRSAEGRRSAAASFGGGPPFGGASHLVAIGRGGDSGPRFVGQ